MVCDQVFPPYNLTIWSLLLGGFLLGRTLSVLTTMTLGTSMAARQGTVAMAAHQICMQVWLAVSLLTDALAASSQVQTFFPFSGSFLYQKSNSEYSPSLPPSLPL